MTEAAQVANDEEQRTTFPAFLRTGQESVLTGATYQFSARNTAGVKDARAGGFPIRVQNRFTEAQMDKQQQYRGEALRRAQQFLDAHADVFGAVNASDARKQLDAALAKLDSAVDLQLARDREARGEKHHTEVLERDLRDRHMMPVVKFALGKLAGTPNIKALTPSASQLKGARLADAARAMAVAATSHAALFKAAAFPADFAQQLTAAADAVQGSIDARRRKVADRRNATSAVEAALKDGRAAALQLEGAVGRLVPRHTPLHDEWLAVKRVVDIAVRAKKETAASAVVGSIQPAWQAAPTPPASATPAVPAPATLTAPQAQEGPAGKVA